MGILHFKSDSIEFRIGAEIATTATERVTVRTGSSGVRGPPLASSVESESMPMAALAARRRAARSPLMLCTTTAGSLSASEAPSVAAGLRRGRSESDSSGFGCFGSDSSVACPLS